VRFAGMELWQKQSKCIFSDIEPSDFVCFRHFLCRIMPSSGMLRRVAHVRTDVSEELITSIIRVTRIGELGTLAVTSRDVLLLLVAVNVVSSSPIFVTLMMEALCSSETSVLTRAIQRNIPEDGLLHSHRHENLKSYIAITGRAL
jgi:hypothetical protein